MPREVEDGETRVAMTPDSVKRISSDHVSVAVESGAGTAAAFPDDAYREVGAEIVADRSALLGSADVVLEVAPPSAEDVGAMREGALVASFMRPHENAELLQSMAGRRITGLSLEMIPRITRAQSMDALSSQSNLAGYKTVLIGADSLGKIFPLMMTAAGTLSPARVLILGAGVAGLQAIATAKRLGAEVWANDIRPDVKEQVESLGGKFVVLGDEPADGEAAGGYAKELTAEEQAKQREQLAQHIAKADLVITTALVPGRPAPTLIDADVLERMKPGAVVVDMAGEAGGNVELSRAGETVVHRGVTIHAPLNLPATLATHASQLLGRNFIALLKPMISEEGGLVVDFEDEVVDGCCVTHAGEVRFSA